MISPTNTYVGLTHAGPATAADEPDRYYPTGSRNYVQLRAPDDDQSAAIALFLSSGDGSASTCSTTARAPGFAGRELRRPGRAQARSPDRRAEQLEHGRTRLPLARSAHRAREGRRGRPLRLRLRQRPPAGHRPPRRARLRADHHRHRQLHGDRPTSSAPCSDDSGSESQSPVAHRRRCRPRDASFSARSRHREDPRTLTPRPSTRQKRRASSSMRSHIRRGRGPLSTVHSSGRAFAAA